MRADAVANREAIIKAAVALFADIGLDVPQRTVAARAGVGIGTLYRHFPDRIGLLRGVAEYVYATMSAAVDTYVATREDAGPTQDSAEAWRAFVAEVVGMRLGKIIPQIAEHSELLADSPWLLEFREQGLVKLNEALSRAKADGLVRQEVDIARFQIGLAQISRPLPDVVEELTPGWEDWLVETYLRGLLP
ncbi:MAG: TetR/AcrR family transcriptional regulator [Actinomyces sp.]|uniref:TetR/AcrR family transcriptional regulator n=1 Tax=Actinomyces sp. TaxID=29317 RepID=UPI0026DC2FC2|nr:TetR/AcrR family transcriptional regulator [Actinomyces sp.]MDO4242863.1 TetR/AcrR family transcriptional regulator [Actinomyces sp.]